MSRAKQIPRQNQGEVGFYDWFSPRTTQISEAVFCSPQEEIKEAGGAGGHLQFQPAAAAGSGSSTECTVARINIYMLTMIVSD